MYVFNYKQTEGSYFWFIMFFGKCHIMQQQRLIFSSSPSFLSSPLVSELKEETFVSLQSEHSQLEGVGPEGYSVTGSENVIGQTGTILLPGLSDIHHLEKALASSSETPPATCDAGCPTF